MNNYRDTALSTSIAKILENTVISFRVIYGSDLRQGTQPTRAL